MALGNSSSMGQARGRNKGTIVKRAKEYHNAAKKRIDELTRQKTLF